MTRIVLPWPPTSKIDRIRLLRTDGTKTLADYELLWCENDGTCSLFAVYDGCDQCVWACDVEESVGGGESKAPDTTKTLVATSYVWLDDSRLTHQNNRKVDMYDSSFYGDDLFCQPWIYGKVQAMAPNQTLFSM